MTLDTSLSLLEQLRRDDSADQWPRLVQLYRPMLERWLRSHDDLDTTDVEDLVQEVLLTLSRELPAFEHNRQPGAFRCWLRRILVNRLRSFWRERRRGPQAVGGSDFLNQLDQLEDDASGISQHWDREHDLGIMRHLMNDLRPRFSPQTWQAFHLQVFEEFSPEKTARQLGLSLSSVYVAKSRILRALRDASRGLVL